ncbi:MAG TPA: winged helix-turn-helix domain-containing protein [Pyrinomonadaceae bacterium]|nr:winged helix-turn-helix domain-containing protein [Pyrinomonadaceae bacterium]
MAVKIRVNRKSVESMTRQIANQLEGLISTGAMAVGSMLPSERTLANSLDVARNVVRGSYDYLERAGLVQREGKAGRRVKAKATRRRVPKTIRKPVKKR